MSSSLWKGNATIIYKIDGLWSLEVDSCIFSALWVVMNGPHHNLQGAVN